MQAGVLGVPPCLLVDAFSALTPGEDCFSDAFHDDMFDTAFLARSRPKRSSLLLAGDFNVDFLPVSAMDPFSHLPDRESKHEDKRTMLQSFLESLHLELRLPKQSGDFPPVEWATECLYAPITRVPMGAQAGLPSTIDFAAASAGFVAEVSAYWLPIHTDHAALSISCNISCRFARATARALGSVRTNLELRIGCSRIRVVIPLACRHVSAC